MPPLGIAPESYIIAACGKDGIEYTVRRKDLCKAQCDMKSHIFLFSKTADCIKLMCAHRIGELEQVPLHVMTE